MSTKAEIQAFQARIGLTGKYIDGVMGPKTIKQLQKKIGVKQDGIVGKNTNNAAKKAGFWPIPTNALQLVNIGPVEIMPEANSQAPVPPSALNTVAQVMTGFNSQSAIAKATTATGGIDARKLAQAWADFGKTWDAYSNRVTDKTLVGLIQKSQSDWQDFYYGNFDVWPESELKRWTGILDSTSKTLNAAIAGSKTVSTLPAVNVPGKLTVRFDKSKFRMIGVTVMILGFVGLAAGGKRR